jgi:hypothetical protein
MEEVQGRASEEKLRAFELDARGPRAPSLSRPAGKRRKTSTAQFDSFPDLRKKMH